MSEADTNTGQKPIDLQNEQEKSTHAFQGFLAARDADNQPDNTTEALQDSDEAEEFEAEEVEADEADETFEDDEDFEEELSGDEDDAEDDVGADEEPDEQLIQLDMDGQQVEVTLDELQKSYLRQSDYTKKTQALAEQRKASETELEALRQERMQYAELLPQLAQQLQTATSPEELQRLNELRESDPLQYMLEKDALDQRQAQLNAVKQEQERLAQTSQAEQQQLLADHLQKETVALMDALPAWKDDAVAQKERQEIREYALSRGFTDAELNEVYDSRAILILRDAMMASQANKRKPKQAVKKTAKAGTSNVRRKSRTRVAKERLSKSGSVRDATAVFENLLDGKR